jgi:hypothetical protein
MSAEIWTWLASTPGFWGFATAAIGGLTIAYVARLRHEARMYESDTDRQIRLGELELRKAEQHPTPELLEITRLCREIEYLRLTRNGATQPAFGEDDTAAQEQPVVQRESRAATEIPSEAKSETSRPIAGATNGRKATRSPAPPPQEQPASKRPPVPAAAMRGLEPQVAASTA